MKHTPPTSHWHRIGCEAPTKSRRNKEWQTVLSKGGLGAIYTAGLNLSIDV